MFPAMDLPLKQEQIRSFQTCKYSEKSGSHPLKVFTFTSSKAVDLKFLTNRNYSFLSKQCRIMSDFFLFSFILPYRQILFSLFDNTCYCSMLNIYGQVTK